MTRQTAFLVLVSGFLLGLAQGCDIEHEGVAPARGKLYFPTALAISAQEGGDPARYLFVANSNFDLAYNSGSVQVFDLDDLDERVADCEAAKGCVADCGADGGQCAAACDAEDEGCVPGCEAKEKACVEACAEEQKCVIPTQDVQQGEVLIGSFAVGMAVSASGERVYVATRSETAVTFIDVAQGEDGGNILDCGQGSGRRCDGDHVRGNRKEDSVGGDIEMPDEPVGLIAGRVTDFDASAAEADDYVMVAHRVGAVSLFLDGPGEAGGPKLVDVLDEALRERITGIDMDSRTGYAYLTSTDISNAIQPKALDRVGVDFEGDDSFLFTAGPLWLTGVSNDRDTRDVAFAPDRLPGKALVVARVPSSLVITDTATDRSDVNWTTAAVVTEVGSGASRITVGRIGDNEKLFAFVSCFNSRELFVIDTELGEPVGVARGFSGPFDVALDRWRERLYVADFRSSTIRIVDLRPVVCIPDDIDTPCDQAAAEGAALPCRCLQNRELAITATLGEPNLPSELI
jgi:DNA-binding beta-propeller fold protein YncE